MKSTIHISVDKDTEEQEFCLPDRIYVSLSSKGIKTTDLGRFIDTKNLQSLQQAHVTQVPLSIALPRATEIVWLDLSRNELSSLPKEMFNGNTTLEYMDVGRNQLKELPPEIGNCKQLKTLIALSNNLRMSGFPLNEIVSLPLLDKLDLRWNKKMNNQSSRRQLMDLFLKPNGKNQKKKFNLLLNPKNDDVNSLTTTNKKLSACDRDANDLRSQIEPLSTPQLRKRLDRTFGVKFDSSDESAYDRENIMQQLLKCYNDGACDDHGRPIPVRAVRHERGVLLDPTLLREIQDEMEAIQWPRTTRERPKIAAQGYVILQRPPQCFSTTTMTDEEATPSRISNNKAKREAEKLKRFSGIWNKALEAIQSVDTDFANRFTALAVTKNFKGSPHIDTLNIAPFYGLSLGDYSNGGKLCVECSPTCVAEIDTRGRFTKVDGRFCHWVSDYDGERYSLIYYVTHGQVVPQTTAIFKPTCISTTKNIEEEKDAYLNDWVSPPIFIP